MRHGAGEIVGVVGGCLSIFGCMEVDGVSGGFGGWEKNGATNRKKHVILVSSKKENKDPQMWVLNFLHGRAKMKKWFLEVFLPMWAKETVLRDNRELVRRLREAKQENARLSAYIRGLEKGLRSLRYGGEK